MNKTVTINISGIIFHIEEDAFEKLSKYLSTIKGYFSRTDGGNEIMSDIEARIAEMLQTKINSVKQVVMMADVDDVINIMGKPEQFADEEQHHSNNEEDINEPGNTENVKKRLFRDPDNKSIGGVCSGIAAYFDVDVVWIRLATFLLIFFGGVSLWVYIILWIVIPEAKTTAEKLSMRGEKIDINSISKTVKEEAEQLKKRMEKYGNDLKNSQYAPNRNFFDKLGDFLKDFLILFTRFFARLVGLVLLFFGIMFMLGLLSTITGFSIAGSNTDFNDWVNLIFLAHDHYVIGIIGLILFFGVPILMMIYGGVKLLFKIRYSNRWLNISAGIIWLIGAVMAGYVAIITGKDFGDGGKIRQQFNIAQKDTLYLKMNPNSESFPGIDLKKEHFGNFPGVHIKGNHHEEDYLVIDHNGEKLIVGHASLNIVPSLTDKTELIVYKRARGLDKRSANERAKEIEYSISQNDSVLLFNEVFTVSALNKFRMQQVEILLKVPTGKVIHIDRNMAKLLYDVENTTNTYDPDMAGRRWIMTKDGLSCIDCSGIEKSHDDAVELPPADLNVNTENANVKIDKHGNINVNSNGTEVKIKSDGNINVKKEN